MRLRVSRIKRKKPNIFGYAIYDLLFPIPVSPSVGSGKSFTNIALGLTRYHVGPIGNGIHVAGAGKRRHAALK
jgi:hypothetical protein